MPNYTTDLNTPLITFAGEPASASLTINAATTGICITGATGSGKTTTSSKRLAIKMMEAGFGGCVLTVKEGEKDQIIAYAKQAGREQDIIVVEPGGQHCFDFLQYETSRPSTITYTENIFQLLKVAIEAGEQKETAQDNDPFWKSALHQYLKSVISICMLAYDRKISVQLLYDVAFSAPKKAQKAQDGDPSPYQKASQLAKIKVKALIDAWKQQHDARIQNMGAAEQEDTMVKEIPEYRTLKMLHQFFRESLCGISEKTRNILDFMVLNFMSQLLEEPFYSLFCSGRSTFTPEDCYLQGKIIIINLPVKLYQKAGTDVQLIFKIIWQKAMERRNLAVNERFVFLFVDEAQHFLHELDTEFQATARGSRIATVYITQNLSSYYIAMGGELAEHRVKSFLANLAVKIFHANNHIETCRYASDLIGEAYVEEQSNSTQVGKDFNLSESNSYRLEKMVRPEALMALRQGGSANNYLADAYVIIQGQKFSNGFHYKKVSFTQL